MIMMDTKPTEQTTLQYQRQGTRSRWGCLNCRKRRKKCDEARPACQICILRRVECSYPDWTMVKYSRTRQRIREYQDANSSTRPALLLQPSSTENRLVYHFNTIVTSLITFSFPQSDISNPFLLHVLPRASNSMQVQRAVEAVAAAHLHHLGAESRERATLLHSQALHLLADEISLPGLDGMSRMNVLAGSLLLIYYEIVLGNSASNACCHLQGAKILLEYQRDIRTPCFAFFRKVFQYFNVMLALSMGQRPLLICGGDCPKFTDKMDTVFGCTGRLWPLMHRLADIIGRIREGEDMTHEAEILATSLEVWSIDSSPSADAYLEAMVQIAKAYKFCGLLVLLSIPGESSTATERYRQIYQAAFDSVLRVCVLSTPMATLTWPLYVVGKLATSMSDRTAIMHIFEQFLEKHHMTVVDGARNAVKAYWDRGSREMDWQLSAPVLLG